MKSFTKICLCLFILHICYYCPSVSEEVTDQEKHEAFCFQKRVKKGQQWKEICDPDSTSTHPYTNFCDYVQCESVTSCDDGYQLVDQIVGHNCCPTCVRLLEEDNDCKPNSLLEQCMNGLVCDPIKQKCMIQSETKACQREYHNRLWIRKQSKKFYIPPELKGKYFELSYFQEQQMPDCSLQSGEYEVKQKTKNKAFCVNPPDGKNTFGVVDSHKSVDLSCKCSTAMYDKLVNGVSKNTPNNDSEEKEMIEKINQINVDHFADTHVKCKASGNYQELQCINETCLCVNEISGFPITNTDEILDATLEKLNSKHHFTSPTIIHYDKSPVVTPAAVIYGALNVLACFDSDKDEKQNIENIADKTYLESCQQKLYRSSFVAQHFRKKGTTLRGLDYIVCGYDDRFDRTQCRTDGCHCSSPTGKSISSYGGDMANSELMDCRCALLEYFATTEKLPFDMLQCDGGGSFSPLQCYQGGKLCYCADLNGAQLSEVFSATTINQFLKQYAPSINQIAVCAAMRDSVNSIKNSNILTDDDQIYFEYKTKSFQILSQKPDSSQMYEKK